MEWISAIGVGVVILVLFAFPYVRKSYKDAEKIDQNLREIRRLNELLITALFQPAISYGWFDADELEWRNESRSAKSFVFRNSLGRLSEFYIGRNNVLAAALWGVWNSIDYFAAPQSFFDAFRQPSEKQDKKLFLHYRALAANAGIQFADGNARTVSTTWAAHRIDEYKDHVDRALRFLQALLEDVQRANDAAQYEGN